MSSLSVLNRPLRVRNFWHKTLMYRWNQKNPKHSFVLCQSYGGDLDFFNFISHCSMKMHWFIKWPQNLVNAPLFFSTTLGNFHPSFTLHALRCVTLRLRSVATPSAANIVLSHWLRPSLRRQDLLAKYHGNYRENPRNLADTQAARLARSRDDYNESFDSRSSECRPIIYCLQLRKAADLCVSFS